MATFLLEIGTEELPAHFLRQALPQLEQQVRHDLGEARLAHGPVQSFGTPRRLAVLVRDLPLCQPDLEDERKGPPASQAFAGGRATQAAIGFAARCGVEPDQLEVRDTPRGPFVFARQLEQGRPSQAVLAERIPAWLSALQGRRFMRWGEGERRFSRPVRWLVALLDDALVPLALEGCDPAIRSDRLSRGHRLDGPPVSLANASDYAKALATAGVMVDREERGRWIRERVLAAARSLEARPDLPDDLFEELVDLVEAPSLIEGQVETRFLALPPEVLRTVMRAHQRYVPLIRSEGTSDPLALEATATLLPRFLCIGNGLLTAEAAVRRGNERVLRARLSDAEFFLAADRAMPSAQRRERLARVTFAEGLGSLRDRSDRLHWLTGLLLERLNLGGATADAALGASLLCKHDLVSQMVGEFPELQGVMGGKYLLAEGAPRAVALAVLEHYLPRGAGDALPGSDAGAVLALAERLELLLSIYAKGERPSGSSDPYALRRAGNGLLQILWERGWRLDLVTLLSRATEHWADLFPAFRVRASVLAEELGSLLRQRLISLLEEEVPLDLVQAVAGESVALPRLLRDPGDARRRAELLQNLRRNGSLAPIQAVVQRASRLAAKGDLDPGVLSPAGVVDPELFRSPSEAAMLAVLETLEPIATGDDPGRYVALAGGLSASAVTLAAFFDGDASVMVMADEAAIRANRLHLLGVLCNQASVLADFSRISG